MKTLIVAVALLLSCLLSPVTAQNYSADNGISFTPVVQNAAYSSGNSLGGLQSVNIFRSDVNPSWIFDNFMISSQGGATTAMTIYIFDTLPSPTACVDKNAVSLATGDVAKLAMAPFVLTPAVVGTGTTVTTAQLTQTVSMRNHDATPTVKLYVCIAAGGTVTPATTSDLVAKISGALD